jgi:hypothetical protein
MQCHRHTFAHPFFRTLPIPHDWPIRAKAKVFPLSTVYINRLKVRGDPEKGKPRESAGRKATGLSPQFPEDMVAGLPGEHSTS